jgi:hypothetical protein
MSEGTVIVGGVVSANVIATWKEALPVFPCASLAVQVTVVVPTGNVEPDAGEQFELVTPTASVNVTVYATTAPAALVAAVVMFAGTVIAGGVVS